MKIWVRRSNESTTSQQRPMYNKFSVEQASVPFPMCYYLGREPMRPSFVEHELKFRHSVPIARFYYATKFHTEHTSIPVSPLIW